MIPASISVLTICGIDEIPSHGSRAVSHVLSVLDPERPEVTEFGGFGEHHRTTLRFHDIIDPLPGRVMPMREHMDAILAFGESLKTSRDERTEGHLLVHCHMGISRSTAAMLTLMADFERSGRLTEQLRLHYGHQLKAQPKYNIWMKDLGRSREIEMAL
jgi:predicted protein tyrosine phosphatase